MHRDNVNCTKTGITEMIDFAVNGWSYAGTLDESTRRQPNTVRYF